MNDTSLSAHPLIKAFHEQGVSLPWITELQKLTPTELATWVNTIDESSYALTEWAEAFLAFESWCKNEKRDLTARHMLEYISCCAESARAGVKLPLPFLLQEFLKTNGVE